MFLMRAYPLLGEVRGGWALEFSSFWAPNGTRLLARCHFTGPKKSRIPGPNLLPLPLLMDMHASKTLSTGLYKLYINSYTWLHQRISPPTFQERTYRTWIFRIKILGLLSYFFVLYYCVCVINHRVCVKKASVSTYAACILYMLLSLSYYNNVMAGDAFFTSADQFTAFHWRSFWQCVKPTTFRNGLEWRLKRTGN